MSTNLTRDQIKAAYLAGALSPVELIELNRQIFGDAQMNADPVDGGDLTEKPEGVTDDEWSALGDPGKRAIVRERERAAKAERELQALRSQANPKPAPPKQQAPEPQAKESAADQPDIAALVQQAVADAIAPMQQERASRELRDAVTSAAGDLLHDPSDALAQIPAEQLTDSDGRPDAARIKSALEGLVKTKPYLAKQADTRRFATPGGFVGGGTAKQANESEVIKASLAKMVAATGAKVALQ
ncbi:MULTISPECIES: hypothetical protein [unclassified Luteococcus]|uniref:hypothetical protein n=1 Tax=unclassified Luteococcus TaxID=2639923 RepID=UPI00313BBF4A